MTDLPRGWVATTLEEIASWSSGGTPSRKRSDYFGGGILWVKTGELTEKYIRKTEESLSDLGVANSSAKVFPKGSVGIAMYGATIGKVSIWGIEASTNQACAVAQPIDGVVSSEFLYHFFRSEKAALIKEGKGGAQPNISQGLLRDWPIALPPFNEQRRIVEKIEAMFDEIDKGVESLQTARTTLGLYRQSLLKSAFEGRLTADWRAQNPDRLEAPETLLARIQKERDNRYKTALDTWQDALTQWHAAGEKGKRPAKPKRLITYPDELQDLEIALPELPHGWRWAHLGLCSLGSEYGTAAKSSDTGEVPVIRMGNLQGGRIDWDKLAFTSDPTEIEKYSLRLGDVLFNRTNSPELVGKTSIYKGERPALFAGYLVRINQIEEIASGPYLTYFLNSPIASEHGKIVKTDGVNQSNINASKLQEYPFPYCSPAEQAEIVRLLDTHLEAAKALAVEIDDALTRADALRQSILKKAFSGQIVPQDPTDEPAADLLARIKVEKAEKEQTARRDRKTAPPRKPRKRRPTMTDLIEVLEKQKDWIPAASAAQELGIGDFSSSDDVEAFYHQLKRHVESGAIEVDRRDDEDWFRLAKAEVG